MRSPWLSREYEKKHDVKIQKINDKYILSSKNNTAILNESEYEKYEQNHLNEIEWEKLYYRGLAKDKNCEGIDISPDLNIDEMNFVKSKGVQSFPLKVDKQSYQILINPELGSWMALNQEEFERYNNDALTNDEWFSLFIRGLAEEKNNVEVDLDFPLPADYPSVIVVNITTGCNLRCKYCWFFSKLVESGQSV